MNAVAVAWALFYYFVLESGDGQTLGKKLLRSASSARTAARPDEPRSRSAPCCA